MTEAVSFSTDEPLASSNLASDRLARRARIATAVLFLEDGMTFATWAALIPSFQRKFGLSAGDLGFVLSAMVIGAMVAMPAAGRVIGRYGSGRVLSIISFAFPASLILLATAPGFRSLIAAAFVFGAIKGAMDVSVNAQGIAVENIIGRPIFASFQAFWSFGGLISAFALSIALGHGATASHLLIFMPIILIGMATAAAGKLVADLSQHSMATAFARLPPRFNSQLLRLGGLAFLGLFSEGVLLDWSAVYAHSVTHVSLSTAPIAFATFSISMAVGRFAGDRIVGRYGTANTLRLSGILAMLGMLLVVTVHVWPALLVGLLMLGLGISNLVPVIFGAAARVHEGNAGAGIAMVTTLGYTGFLSGPPTIGFLAALAGLPVAFCVVIVFGFLIATLGVSILRSAGQARPQVT